MPTVAIVCLIVSELTFAQAVKKSPRCFNLEGNAAHQIKMDLKDSAGPFIC